jgi:hypothetical protein
MERERERESMKISNAIAWLVVQLSFFSCSFLSHMALHSPLSLCKPLGTKSPKNPGPHHHIELADVKVFVAICTQIFFMMTMDFISIFYIKKISEFLQKL